MSTPARAYGPLPLHPLAVAAAVLGVLAVLGAWVPLLGLTSLVLGAGAVALAVVALRAVRARRTSGRAPAWVGLGAGSLAVVLALAVTGTWVVTGRAQEQATSFTAGAQDGWTNLVRQLRAPDAAPRATPAPPTAPPRRRRARSRRPRAGRDPLHRQRVQVVRAPLGPGGASFRRGPCRGAPDGLAVLRRAGRRGARGHAAHRPAHRRRSHQGRDLGAGEPGVSGAPGHRAVAATWAEPRERAVVVGGLPVAAVVVGILALAWSWLPMYSVLDVPVALAAVVLGSTGAVQARAGRRPGFAVAVAGAACGALALAVVLVVNVAFALSLDWSALA